MPPGKPLPDAEKAVLRAWIAAGPSWGTDPIDPYRLTTDNRGGFDWWSLQSIRCATLPAVARHAWARNPIDRFVLAKLEAHRLAPSPRADRRTLLRRLTFDLLGLPPTPEEVTGYACGFVLVS